MKYLYILNYGYNPGVIICCIHKDENSEDYITEQLDLNLNNVEWMETDTLNIQTIHEANCISVNCK